MKKSVLSLVSIMALSGLAYAGGDMTTAVEPVIEIPEVVEDVSGFYIGLGFGEVSVNDDYSSEEIGATTMTLQAGYQYNAYLAVEGRYAFNLGSVDYDAGIFTGLDVDFDGDVYSWGIYAKPMYSFDSLTLYGLLGYGEIILEDLDGGDSTEGGFQWGAGVSYAFTEEISLFVDYVMLYDDKGFDNRAVNEDIDADTWTVGVSYKF